MSIPVKYTESQKAVTVQEPLKYNPIPVKEIGNGILASAVFLMAYYLAQYGLPVSILAGCSTWLGYRLYFGSDATLADLYAGIRGLPPEIINDMLNSATSYLARIRTANDRISDRSLAALLHDISDTGSKIVEELKENPQKLIEASRFVTVYLEGAASVSENFVSVFSKSDSKEEVSANYRTFLENTQSTFQKQSQALIADEKVDLELDIKVLNTRMASEVIRK